MSRAMTGTPLVDLDTPLVGPVGKKAADALAAKLGLHTVGDLVRHYPRRYVDRGKLTEIAGLELGEHVTVLAEVEKVTMRDMRHRRGKLMQVVITDGRGRRLDCTFFNPFKLQKVMVPGLRALFSGQVSRFRDKLQLTHPEFEPIEESEGVRPFLSIYPATQGSTPGRSAVACARCSSCSRTPRIPFRSRCGARRACPSWGRRCAASTCPRPRRTSTSAKHRLVWDEALGVQLALALRRRRAVQRPAAANPHVPGGLLEAFDARLPYTLTAGQRSVGAEIAADLAVRGPDEPAGPGRRRRGQDGRGAAGDVAGRRQRTPGRHAGAHRGARRAARPLAAVAARAARARPASWAGPSMATRVTLLSGSLPAAAKKKALLEAVSGEAGIVVGTHALIQDRVEFAELGLVVVDEQHRFGVEQRDALRGRGEKAPHLLVMTATPIPRTVAMTVYGDLEVSALRELPGGRSPIATTVVPAGEKPAWLERVWSRIREEVAAGHQVYVVCPRVGGDTGKEEELPDDPDSGLDAAGAGPDERRAPLAVLDVKPKLEEGPLAGLRLGCPAREAAAGREGRRDAGVRRGEIDVLVATTVVEVGVDVPNSTAMVILDADRFGLSQLHQLRGRVGRGSAPGVCLLVTDVPAGTTARERLDAVASTTDGFELARMDLELRREGDVLGSLQSGRRSGLRLLSLLRHEDVIAKARVHATEIVEADPGLQRHPGLHALVAETVGDEERAAYLDKV